MTSLSCICNRLPHTRAASRFAGPLLRQASSQAGGSSSADSASPQISSDVDSPSTTSTEEAAQEPARSTGRDSKKLSPTAWLSSQEGIAFKRPAAGRTNWIGRTPFPLNPSFRPPTPLSDSQKTRIYRAFVAAVQGQTESASSSTPASSSSQSQTSPTKSESYYIRKLALQYNLSMDRIRAIVRLKALEENMQKQGKQVQGKFLAGMEEALGVRSGDVGQVYIQGLKEPVAGMVQETKEGFAMGKKSHWIMVDEEAGEESIATNGAGGPQHASDSSSHATRKSKIGSRATTQGPRIVNANSQSKTKSDKRQLMFVDVPTTRIDRPRSASK